LVRRRDWNGIAGVAAFSEADAVGVVEIIEEEKAAGFG
jgi:hypothetical protein